MVAAPIGQTFGPKAQFKMALVIIGEHCLMDGKMFALVEVILKDLQCSGRSERSPHFGGIAIVLGGECLKPLPTVSSGPWLEQKVETIFMSMYKYVY